MRPGRDRVGYPPGLHRLGGLPDGAGSGVSRTTAVLLAAAVGILLSSLAPELQAHWGAVRQEAAGADYRIGLLWSLLLGGSITLWPVPRRHRRALLLVWAGKCLVVLGVMLVHDAHYAYRLDAYYYFEQYRLAAPPWRYIALGRPGSVAFVVTFAWLQSHLLAASYHAVTASFAMVGLVAVYVLYRAYTILLGTDDRRLLYLLGFCPSILFWSSTLGKEPFVLLGIALYAYGVIGWSRLRETRCLAAIPAGILLAMLIRVWMGPILILPLALVFLRAVRGTVPRLAAVAVSIILLGSAVSYVAGDLHVRRTGDVYARINGMSRGLHGGSALQRPLAVKSLTDLAALAPAAAFTALFRPLPGEVPNAFGTWAGLENLALLILAVAAGVRTRLATLRDPLVQWALAVLVLWALAYGFVSYQNLGAAVRFKVQVLPLLLGVLLHLWFRGRRGLSGTGGGLDAASMYRHDS